MREIARQHGDWRLLKKLISDAVFWQWLTSKIQR